MLYVEYILVESSCNRTSSMADPFTILGAVTGVVSALTAGVSAFTKWRRYRKEKKKQIQEAEEALQESQVAVRRNYDDRYDSLGSIFEKGDGKCDAIRGRSSSSPVARHIHTVASENDGKVQADGGCLHRLSDGSLHFRKSHKNSEVCPVHTHPKSRVKLTEDVDRSL